MYSFYNFPDFLLLNSYSAKTEIIYTDDFCYRVPIYFMVQAYVFYQVVNIESGNIIE